MDILEEYRGQSDRTICIVGTIILSTKICMVDGKFSLYEKDEILKTFPTKDPKKKETILDIIDKASKDKNDIKNALKALDRSNQFNHIQGAVSRNNITILEKKEGTQNMLKKIKINKKIANGVLVKFPKKKTRLQS